MIKKVLLKIESAVTFDTVKLKYNFSLILHNLKLFYTLKFLKKS